MYENNTAQSQQGYVALVVVVIITAVLIIVSATISQTGYMSRFSVLGFERKRQATTLAEGCLEYARLKLVQNHSYTPQANGDLATLAGGVCKICSVTGSGGIGSGREVKVRSKQASSLANFEADLTLGLTDVSIDYVLETPTYTGPACSL